MGIPSYLKLPHGEMLHKMMGFLLLSWAWVKQESPKPPSGPSWPGMIDEVDLVLHPLRSELNFPIGPKNLIEHAPERGDEKTGEDESTWGDY